MALDAIDDNIVSAESPDDNEELFDTNEFLDLDEDIDPETGLYFQSSQA